ncbi:ABC transporter substrate-binding protein [Phytoactinopolyspora limicola]|uniref:ABC transporter substrate-binding protein n=1 Tax=Phytoactinopolyspora limicola TaxID=2715536 RepID=UPI0014077CEA|nr:ABC transporter substrate-binding protein [Phytoactinopolyspora limicola]
MRLAQRTSWLAAGLAAGLALAACGGDDGTGGAGSDDDATGGAADAPMNSDAGDTDANGTVAVLDDNGCVAHFDADVDYFADKVEPVYANGWSVRYENSYKVLTTRVDAAGGHAAAGSRVVENTYVLVPCGAPEPELTGELDGATVLEIPTGTFVDGGSVLYAAVERLDVADALVGHAEVFFGDTEAPYLPKVAERVDSGAVAEIGYEVNFEALADADPDFYTNYAGDDSMFGQITQLGIPIVHYFPYTESPLGAAEQVKFLSLFFNLEAEANAEFDAIEERYLDLREQVEQHASTLDEAPTMLLGVTGDGSDVTTRENRRFEPQLVREAGGVPIPDIDGGGIATISLERFLDEGSSADAWLDLTFFPSHETQQEYLDAEPHLAELRPLNDGHTYHRMGQRGVDYFLNGALDVDLMLADAVSILHPDLLPDHELTFIGAVASSE